MFYISYTSIDAPKDQDVDGIVDMTFIWTQCLNQFFLNKERANILLTLDSLTMDLLVTIQLLRFLLFGNTYRLFFTIIPFYGLRAII